MACFARNLSSIALDAGLFVFLVFFGQSCATLETFHVNDGHRGYLASSPVSHHERLHQHDQRSRAAVFLQGVSSDLILRRYFTDQDVAWADHGTTLADKAVLIQVAQGFVATTWNFAGKLFFTEFGFANFDFEFFDVNRSKAVFTQAGVR